jgi:ribonucleotide reductase alpha subunit
MASSYLSFSLSDEFIEEYKDREIPWGFPIGGGNSLGELTFISKYSRKKEDGTKERWHECCRRVIEGMYSILKDHCNINRTPWNEAKAQRSAKDAFERMFVFKWLPPGRGLWMMGTEFVHADRNSAALQNCSFISTEKLSIHSYNEAVLPFARLMEMSMLGIGVGMDTRGAGKLVIHAPREEIFLYEIEDSREGWADSTAKLLASYLLPNQKTVQFDYSLIRPAGEPIKRFGGIAPGPAELIKLHDRLRNLFDGREDEKITSTDIADVANMIGKAVVSGGVRRTAEVLFGDPMDKEFINLKNWEVNPVRMGEDGWGHLSNNSIFTDVGENYDYLIPNIVMNGEPGFSYLNLSREYGRLVDPPNFKDKKVMGNNPCVTSDTWIMTSVGPRQVSDLVDTDVSVLVNGKSYDAESWGFFQTGIKQVYTLTTKQGYKVRLTGDHKVLTSNGWKEAQNLVKGDKLVLNNHGAQEWAGNGNKDEGYLLGLLLGDGTINNNQAIWSVWSDTPGNVAMRERVKSIVGKMPHRSDWNGWSHIAERNEYRLKSAAATGLAKSWDMIDSKHITPKIEKASSLFCEGFLRGLFDADGHVEGNIEKGVSIRLGQANRNDLEAVQRMLNRLGIKSTIYGGTPAKAQLLPDGHGGSKLYDCKQTWRLSVSGEDTVKFMERIGFTNTDKSDKYYRLTSGHVTGFYPKKDLVDFDNLIEDGIEPVYDITVSDVHAFDGNGLYLHNCLEQPLENWELCCLVETFPYRNDNLDDYINTLKVAYLYGKAVTLLPTPWPESNEVMQRNRRIGCSMSGIVQFAEAYGWTELRTWMNTGYKFIQDRDKLYSEWLGVRESIKTTSIKPSGTVSLLAGATPGVHWPIANFYIRRMRFNKLDPLIEIFKQAGYKTEPSYSDPDSDVVIEFPTRGPNVRTEKEVTVWEKASLAILAQRYWADNNVSVTLTFQPHEAEQIEALLRAFDGQLKALSFLPIGGEKKYPQMPYETMPENSILELSSKIQPVDWNALYDGESLDAQGESGCTNDYCEVKY